MKLIPLRCPACQADLPHQENDSIFYCLDCCKGFELLASGEFLGRKVAFLPPPEDIQSSQKIRYLPFWCYGISLTLSTANPNKQHVLDRFRDLKWVFVCACATRGLSYFGDPGVNHTAIRTLPRGDVLKLPLVGGWRSGTLARNWVSLTVLSILDRMADVTDIHMSVSIKSEHLAAMPYLRDGDFWLDLMAQERYPSTAFPDLSHLS